MVKDAEIRGHTALDCDVGARHASDEQDSEGGVNAVDNVGEEGIEQCELVLEGGLLAEAAGVEVIGAGGQREDISVRVTLGVDVERL